jgi:hypothetical protein
VLNPRIEGVEPKHLQQSVNGRLLLVQVNVEKTFLGTDTPVLDKLLMDRIKENECGCQAGAASFLAPMKY